MEKVKKIYLSLGSNLRDKKANIKKTIEEISLLKDTNIKTKASLYQTTPLGIKKQSLFINTVIEVITKKSPFLLLKNLITIEKKLGKTGGIKWGPRIIDIDILLYDNLVIQTRELIIPHPLLQERLFVLIPLNEIAGNILHPVFKKSIKQLLKECKKEKWSEGNILLLTE